MEIKQNNSMVNNITNNTNISNNINNLNQYKSIYENSKRIENEEKPVENIISLERKDDNRLSNNFSNNINNKRKNINNEEKNNIINNNMKANNSANIPKSSFNINPLSQKNNKNYDKEVKNNEFKGKNYKDNNSTKINENNQNNINKSVEDKNRYINKNELFKNNKSNFVSAEFSNKNNNKHIVEISNLNNSEQNFRNNLSYNFQSQNKIINNTFNFNNNSNNKKYKASDYSNNNLNINNNFLNYIPLIQEKVSNSLYDNEIKYEEQNNKYSNFNQSNKYNNEIKLNSNSSANNFKISRQNKNNYRNNNDNNSIMNKKPLNNFNPNLIRRKGTPQADVSSFLKKNEKGGPIKIINNIKSDSVSKKPTTPILYHYNNTGFIDKNHNKYKYNTNISNSKPKEIKNNTMSNGFGYSGINNFNRKIGIQRPSTAPHKDKEKNKDNKNNYRYKINIGNIRQSKVNNFDRGIKFNKRPNSAGGNNKNDYIINNSAINRDINKQNENNNIIRNNYGIGINKRLASPQINSSSNMGFNNNNMKHKFNPSKYRIPSPVVKSKNYKRPPLPNRGPKIITDKRKKFN
jgi:hypothetical protein